MNKLVSVFAAMIMISVPVAASAQEQAGPVQFRTAIGFGGMAVSDQAGNNIDGSSIAVEAYLGSHLGNHLVLGVYLSDTASFLNNSPSDVNLFSIGPYLDLFIRPDALGWHLMFASGVSAMNIASMRTDTALGGNFNTGLGYDWPMKMNGVYNGGKIGFLLKETVSGVSFPNGWQENAVVPTLLLSVGY